MSRIRSDERGQSLVLSLMALIVLVGMAAFVMDVGVWFRGDRRLQQVADASALAGAQKLPASPDAASSTASSYAAKNGGPALESVQITSVKATNDTIKVSVKEPSPGFLSGVLGIKSVTLRAKATATSSLPGKVKWVAPIVVNEKHPLLNCVGGPCFNQSTTLDYYNIKNNGGQTDGAGNFGFVDLTGEGTGTSELKKQILYGLDQYIGPGTYSARTGNPFSAIKTELQSRIGQEVLFPIYRKLTGNGTNAKYEIIGWVGFVITSLNLQGNNEKINGYFTRVVWDGIEANGGSPPDYGVRTVSLTE